MTVNRYKVVKALCNINIRGNNEGLIPGYNVLVNQLPVAFWNGFADRITEACPQDRIEEIEEYLVECASECGYHTGYGIITSDEFKSVVEPMITNGALDVLRGAYAVFTAWGWAKSGIRKHVAGEKLVIWAHDYYEADLAKGIKKSKRLKAYMIRGVSKAFMDLAYGEPYPNGYGTFDCIQTKGIEWGDAIGEFVVTRKKS